MQVQVQVQAQAVLVRRMRASQQRRQARVCTGELNRSVIIILERIHRPLTRVTALQPNPYMCLLVLSRVHFTTHSMKA